MSTAHQSNQPIPPAPLEASQKSASAWSISIFGCLQVADSALDGRPSFVRRRQVAVPQRDPSPQSPVFCRELAALGAWLLTFPFTTGSAAPTIAPVKVAGTGRAHQSGSPQWQTASWRRWKLDRCQRLPAGNVGSAGRRTSTLAGLLKCLHLGSHLTQQPCTHIFTTPSPGTLAPGWPHPLPMFLVLSAAPLPPHHPPAPLRSYAAGTLHQQSLFYLNRRLPIPDGLPRARPFTAFAAVAAALATFPS